MLYSVIDIGSNTVKCQVYSVDGSDIEPKFFFTKQLGLIAKISGGILPEYAIKELTETINEYKDKTNSWVYCFATESLRKTKNLDEIAERIKTNCDLELELISGKDEALLSFAGFRACSPDITDGIMVDMGGGSTEILKFSDSRPLNLNSFKFGCLSLRKDHVKGRFPRDEEITSIKTKVADELSKHPWIKDCQTLCLIGGTGSAIGKLAFELGYTTGPEFSSDTFMKLFEHLSNPDEHTTVLLEKYIPARIETIIPGMCAYRQIIETVDAETVAEKYEIETRTVDLTPVKEAEIASITDVTELNESALANMAPRIRMLTLYSVAAAENRLVAGTGNKSEAYVGYFTKWGDGAHDFNPIADLTVTEIYDFLRFLDAPKRIIEKAPSAALFDGQTDEEEMGVTYAELDSFLSGENIAEDKRKIIEHMHKLSEHKRKGIITFKK